MVLNSHIAKIPQNDRWEMLSCGLVLGSMNVSLVREMLRIIICFPDYGALCMIQYGNTLLPG